MSGQTYTPAEVAAVFPGMTEAWLKRKVTDNQVPHLRINRTVILFTAEHIDAIKRMYEVKPRKAS